MPVIPVRRPGRSRRPGEVPDLSIMLRAQSTKCPLLAALGELLMSFDEPRRQSVVRRHAYASQACLSFVMLNEGKPPARRGRPCWSSAFTRVKPIRPTFVPRVPRGTVPVMLCYALLCYDALILAADSKRARPRRSCQGDLPLWASSMMDEAPRFVRMCPAHPPCCWQKTQNPMNWSPARGMCDFSEHFLVLHASFSIWPLRRG